MKRILFVELSGYRSLPTTESLQALSAGASVDTVTDKGAAITALRNQAAYTILVVNAPVLPLLSAARDLQPQLETILVTDAPMKEYSAALAGREDQVVDHVVANRAQHDWTELELRVTIQKIIRGEIFGIEKYMSPGTPIRSLLVQGSGGRDLINKTVQEYCLAAKLGQHLAKLAFGISEELLMNIIYDAPAAAGLQAHIDRPRTEAVVLASEEAGHMSFACDGRLFAIGASDPFGALSRDTFRRYLRKVLHRSDSKSLIDTKKGGAGLGLFKILYSSHGLVCNVQSGKRTEMIALIDLEEQLRDFSTMTRSIHYFHIS